MGRRWCRRSVSTSGVGRSVLKGRNPGDAAGRPGAGAVLLKDEQSRWGFPGQRCCSPAHGSPTCRSSSGGLHNVRVVPIDEIDVRAGEPALPRNLTPRCREVTRGFSGMPVTPTPVDQVRCKGLATDRSTVQAPRRAEHPSPGEIGGELREPLERGVSAPPTRVWRTWRGALETFGRRYPLVKYT